ncbi:MerR family transcriptional regulator, light-induced transcriptional regulator [Azospirillaceae bacterium]
MRTPQEPQTPVFAPKEGKAIGRPIPITLIEYETGLAKEVVRKWEARYGFPCPERDDNGNRLYPAEQVSCLRLIHRLLGTGLRPAKVVGLDLVSLEQLVEKVVYAKTAANEFGHSVMEALKAHDVVALSEHLKAQLNRQGLLLFVTDTVSCLNNIVGDAWFRGEIRVYDEHVYTEIVCDILKEAIRSVENPHGSPRILMTTPPNELHTIGMVSANAVAALNGACCIRLGPQTPAAEIIAAVADYRIDIVGLSFSMAYPRRDAAKFLRDLRSRLDPAVDIWAGGRGVSMARNIDRIFKFSDIHSIKTRISAWRANSKRLDPFTK